MVTIDVPKTTLTMAVPGTKPTVTADPGPPVGFAFNSPTIDANGSIRLKGTAGDSVAGWTLGFVQLKYIGTNHSRYRGATVRDGSILITHSNQIVCRDTDIGSTEVWYDSLNSGGTTGPTGTNKLAAGTVIPATGFLDVPAHLFDQPSRWWASVEPNPIVTGHPNNFLHYTVVELLFCTMLVAQEPGGKFHLLKHFYWNVIWEHTFKVDGTGAVVLDKAVRLQQNVQRPSHSGNPRDSKFLGKEFDLKLPVSNTVSRRAPAKIAAKDWKQG
ncbi:hypothetical protein [Limnoglobus roseus]|uniref:Uncharacterized protein n=1 Tax=Limnoglobus roseus TaxID=2598579 RepID=A0A5C1AHK0_9BACT|nr:hypothetical protein [Limnoglobus roseus]QEL18919.1 hypothetical protein PX52LOC_05969 [Limnoglobus roseus]